MEVSENTNLIFHNFPGHTCQRNLIVFEHLQIWEMERTVCFLIHFQDRAAAVVSLCVNLACLLAVLSEPFMPSLSSTLLEQLNTTKDEVNILLTPGKDSGLLFG